MKKESLCNIILSLFAQKTTPTPLLLLIRLRHVYYACRCLLVGNLRYSSSATSFAICGWVWQANRCGRVVTSLENRIAILRGRASPLNGFRNPRTLSRHCVFTDGNLINK